MSSVCYAFQVVRLSAVFSFPIALTRYVRFILLRTSFRYSLRCQHGLGDLRSSETYGKGFLKCSWARRSRCRGPSRKAMSEADAIGICVIKRWKRSVRWRSNKDHHRILPSTRNTHPQTSPAIFFSLSPSLVFLPSPPPSPHLPITRPCPPSAGARQPLLTIPSAHPDSNQT